MGGFAVQIGEHNPFGKIPVDQACEETVNRDTQTAGGTKGFSLKSKAVSKYYLVAEYRTEASSSGTSKTCSIWTVLQAVSITTYKKVGSLKMKATDDGSLRKNKKSLLAKDFQKDVPAAESIPPSSACFIDGMALVQRLKGDGNTFAEIADVSMAMVLQEGALSKQIDVVFDVHRETLIKNTERER